MAAADRADSRHDLAEERTDWAQERTLLAKERTFSAWIRTGISAMAAGLAIARLLGQVRLAWIPMAIGVILIVTGATICVLGFLSYRKALRRLAEEGVRAMPLWLIGIITSALVVSGGLALLLIFEE